MSRQTSRDRWRELQRRCEGVPTNTFFPTTSGTATAARYEAAKRVYCQPCPLRQDCLEAAMRAEGSAAAESRYGLHGGCTPDERYELHLQRTAQAASA